MPKYLFRAKQHAWWSEFQEEDQTVAIVTFKASPAPADNQVIWHYSPSQAEEMPPPPGSLPLQAGFASDDGRYEALPIEVNGYEITATLKINSPANDLEHLKDGVFYVEVFNDHGSQKYQVLKSKNVIVISSMGNIGIIMVVTLVFGVTLFICILYCFVSASNNDNTSQTWPPTTPVLKEVYYYEDESSE